MSGPAPNGVKDELTAAPQQPPWANVDPWAIIDGLQRQVASQATEVAAMRAYIGQLHEALAATAGDKDKIGPLPPEVTSQMP